MSHSEEIPILAQEESIIAGNETTDAFAKPIDEYGGLQLAITLIRSHRPELSESEVHDLAISSAHAFTVIENHRANTADIAQKVNAAFTEGSL